MSKLAEFNFDLIHNLALQITLMPFYNILESTKAIMTMTMLPFFLINSLFMPLKSPLLNPVFGMPNLKIAPLWNNGGVNTRLRKMLTHIGEKQTPLLSQKMTSYEEISYKDIMTIH
jgi:hypothetical protein